MQINVYQQNISGIKIQFLISKSHIGTKNVELKVNTGHWAGTRVPRVYGQINSFYAT